jgi:MoaA/NifB/PqqE/SkfB family radical SAM enzyme
MYCPLPFNHTAISTKGYYKVCCQHETPEQFKFHVNDGDFTEWQKNIYCNEVKDYFKKSLKHPGCSACWNVEEQGDTSYRQRILKEYKILGAKECQEQLLNVEIAVGNLCNLSCLMCNENSSSVILAENVRLKINKASQQDFVWNEENFVGLSKNLNLKPKVINLRGGEPFYNKKIFNLLDSFDQEDVKDTVIHITTNGTQWTSEWDRVLSKFKLVRLMFSVDAVGDLYNYIRYPGNFSTVEQNIKTISRCKNIKPLIHSTVQNLNILYLNELINWAKELNIYLEFDTVTRPNYFHYSNLPGALKIKAIDNINILLKDKLDGHIQKNLLSFLSVLKTSEEDKDLWGQFVANISIRDSIRNNSYQKFLR